MGLCGVVKLDTEVVSLLSEVFQLMDRRHDGVLELDEAVEYILFVSPNKPRKKVEEDWSRRIVAYGLNRETGKALSTIPWP